MTSKSFGDQVPKILHLVHQGKGGLAGEIADVRRDTEAAFTAIEAQSGYPILNSMDGYVPKYGGDVVLRGLDLLQAQTFAELVIGATTSALTITALKPGAEGNDYTVVVTASGGGETAVLVGTVLTLDVDDGTTTADAIATLINVNGGTCDGYLRCASGGVGTVHPPAASTPLVGGVGAGFTCLINGTEALPANTAGTAGAAALGAVACAVTVPDLSASLVTDDCVSISIEADGVLSNLLTGVIKPVLSLPLGMDWIDGANITAAGGDSQFEGRNLLQGQEFAEITIGTGTSELVITALKPGAGGNDYTVVVTASGGGQTAVLAGTVLTLDVDDGTSTADAIATLINVNGGTCDGYLRCASGGVGTVHPPATSAPLVGGIGEGFECLVSGAEALPGNTAGTAGAAAIDDDGALVTVPNLTGLSPARAATDFVACEIVSNGVRSNALSVVLA